MGKKKRLIMKRRKFGRKHANHPVLKNRAPKPITSELVVEHEPVVEDDSVVTSNAYVNTTDDADLLLALLQEPKEVREPVPAPLAKKAPVKRKTTKKRTTTKRSKRTTVKKDK